MLADAKMEIVSRLAPHAEKVKPRWENNVEGRVTEGYGESLLNYMDVVNVARKLYGPTLRNLGDELAALGRGPEWREQEQIVQLKQEFVHVVEKLRHDPGKGPGLAFFAPNGELIEYAAGSLWRPEVPFTRAEQVQLLEAFSRRETAICGERTAIARKIGVKYPELGRVGDDDHQHAPEPLLRRAASFMAHHSMDIYLAAGSSDVFKGSTLQIGIKVCGSCLPPVVNAGVAAIITDTDAASNGIRHIRQASMDAMANNLPPHIAHREIVRQVPITLG